MFLAERMAGSDRIVGIGHGCGFGIMTGQATEGALVADGHARKGFRFTEHRAAKSIKPTSVPEHTQVFVERSDPEPDLHLAYAPTSQGTGRAFDQGFGTGLGRYQGGVSRRCRAASGVCR